MKIAYLVNQYPQPSQSFIRREIGALEQLGVEIHRFTVRAWPQALVDPGDQAERHKTRAVLSVGAVGLAGALVATILRAPLRFCRAARLAWSLGKRGEKGRLFQFVYLAEACVLLRWLRAAGVEHVHSHFGTNGTTVALLVHALGGPPYSFTCHGPEEFDRPTAIKLGEKIRAARFVVAVSEFGRSQLFRWCPHDQWAKIHVIHCGLAADFLAAPPVPVPDNSQLVCVARLAEQKGQLLLLEAVARVRDQGVDFNLILAGDGPMRGDAEALIDRLNLRDRVTVTGWVSNGQVLQLLKDSRAMILPSFAEGLPVVIMEALATGRPVVSTYIAGIPELVEPGVTGYLVPAGAVGELSMAIVRVLTENVIGLRAIGEAGARAVRERHDARTEAVRILDLVRQSLAQTRGTPSYQA